MLTNLQSVACTNQHSAHFRETINSETLSFQLAVINTSRVLLIIENFLTQKSKAIEKLQSFWNGFNGESKEDPEESSCNPSCPDGSAFQKCNKCGVSVAVALAGMLECEPNKEVKRFKGVGVDVEEKQSFWDLLIVMAPFHFFMKEFTKTRTGGDWIEINREGFEVWKKMSEKDLGEATICERSIEAYQKALLKESNDGLKVDNKADSANAAGNNVMIWKRFICLSRLVWKGKCFVISRRLVVISDRSM